MLPEPLAALPAALAPLVLPLHVAATCAMAGLVWFVQLVHYPLMRRVDAGGWVGYEREPTRRTTRIVAPLMGAEAATGVLLLAGPAAAAPGGLALCGAALLAIAWGCTFLVQVPLHARLERAHDAALVERLVATNWARTAAWSARAVLVLLLAPAAA